MSDFEDIRPYHDDEIPAKIEQLLSDSIFMAKVCAFKFPLLYRMCPPLVSGLTRTVIRRVAKDIHGIQDLHDLLSSYVERVVDTTTSGFTYTGIANLPRNKPLLLISNHRDIALDSIFVNYAAWLNKFPPIQIAIGDNLFTEGFGTEFMRINGGFLVKRSAENARALYTALSRTSNYIRETLEEGHSIWIAQREGRSKDGLDITDPAILKMFMLAYKGEVDSVTEWLAQVNLIPVALTYELDPCAPLKAKELEIREAEGCYTKTEDEDFRSIAKGLLGHKGHVHVGFGPPVQGEFEDVQTLAKEIDDRIANLIQPFPTFEEASRLLQGDSHSVNLSGRLKQEFEHQLNELGDMDPKFLLQQYANQYHAPTP